jgi:hypothetical protein
MVFVHFRSKAESASRNVYEPIHLASQNWKKDDWQWFYRTTQGSELLDYSWFMALERPHSQERFIADRLKRFGYLPNPKNKYNPDSLPVGFVADQRGGHKYIGMTCAACHTGQLEYKETLMQIDGAPTRGDLYAFLTELRDALQATRTDDDKFERFAQEVLGGGNTPIKRTQLRTKLSAYTDRFNTFLEKSLPLDNQWGFARADAFGMIFNRVATYDLGVTSNYKTANAPVSYPFLWGIAYHDKVQWDGSAPNENVLERLARNVGEVLGVFATLKLDKPTPWRHYYPTSVDRSNLIALEHKIKSLRAPKWPSQYLGQPNPTLVNKGEPLYAQYCAAQCHKPFDSAHPTRVKVFMDPLDQVRTDPDMVLNARQRTVNTGRLAGTPLYMLIGPDLRLQDSGSKLLINTVAGAILYPRIGPPPTPHDTVPDDRPSLRSALSVGAIPKEARTIKQTALLRNLLFSLETFGAKRLRLQMTAPAYKARPLDGIWATAPYLHNGSVVSLWELMLSEEDRKTKFYVGSPKFDPVDVGLDTNVSSGFVFNTTLPGNHNTGHSGHLYGTDLPDDQKRAIVEYMKTL